MCFESSGMMPNKKESWSINTTLNGIFNLDNSSNIPGERKMDAKCFWSYIKSRRKDLCGLTILRGNVV